MHWRNTCGVNTRTSPLALESSCFAYRHYAPCLRQLSNSSSSSAWLVKLPLKPSSETCFFRGAVSTGRTCPFSRLGQVPRMLLPSCFSAAAPGVTEAVTAETTLCGVGLVYAHETHARTHTRTHTCASYCTFPLSATVV